MTGRNVNEGRYGGRKSDQDEGFDGEGGSYGQGGMMGDRGNNWNSTIRSNIGGEKSRGGRFEQRERYKEGVNYQDEGDAGDRERYGQERMGGDRRNNLSFINRSNRIEVISRGGQNKNQLVIEGWKEILVLSLSKILLTLLLNQETTKLSKLFSVIQDIT